MGTDEKLEGVERVIEYVFQNSTHGWDAEIRDYRLEFTGDLTRLVEIIREEFVDVAMLLQILKASSGSFPAHLRLYADGSGHLGCGREVCCVTSVDKIGYSWGSDRAAQCLRDLAKGLPAQTQANDIETVQVALGIRRKGLEAFGRLCEDGLKPRTLRKEPD